MKYVFKPYNPLFPKLYALEQRRIASALPDAAIEHVGSTAVPGLGGKGIIDIAIAVPPESITATIKTVESLGYEYKRAYSTPERHFLIQDRPDPEEGIRRYHVHVTFPESMDWIKFIHFRDHLRNNPEAMHEYAEIKIMAAAVAGQDGEKYRLLKQPLFQKVNFQQEETFIEAGEAKLFCRSFGNGAPLIVVHGGPGLSQEYLLPHLLPLSEKNRVSFYDQRGSGSSTGGADPAHLTLDVFLNDLDAVRRALGYDKISLLGHSWGGFLAMHYAIKYPQHVDKLILLSALPATSSDYEAYMRDWTDRIAPFKEQLDHIEKSLSYSAGDPEAVADYIRLCFQAYCFDKEKVNALNLKMSPQAALNWLHTSNQFDPNLFNTSFDLRPQLQKLACPTLIIHGDADPIPAAAAANTHHSIPHSQLNVLSHCGHFPYLEQPKEFFEILKPFLK